MADVKEDQRLTLTMGVRLEQKKENGRDELTPRHLVPLAILRWQ